MNWCEDCGARGVHLHSCVQLRSQRPTVAPANGSTPHDDRVLTIVLVTARGDRWTFSADDLPEPIPAHVREILARGLEWPEGQEGSARDSAARESVQPACPTDHRCACGVMPEVDCYCAQQEWQEGEFERAEAKHFPAALLCGQVLVGRGTDTWDPVCVLAEGHTGACDWNDPKRAETKAPEDERVPTGNRLYAPVGEHPEKPTPALDIARRIRYAFGLGGANFPGADDLYRAAKKIEASNAPKHAAARVWGAVSCPSPHKGREVADRCNAFWTAETHRRDLAERRQRLATAGVRIHDRACLTETLGAVSEPYPEEGP